MLVSGTMISQRLRQLRQEKNLTLDQLATLSGINRATIHRIEADEVSPRVDTLNDLCHAFGLGLHDFFQPAACSPPPNGPEAPNSNDHYISTEISVRNDADRQEDGVGIRRGLMDWFEHLEALVHESMDMLAVLDQDGFILYESPSTMHMLGCTRGERSTHPWCHWVHPDDQDLLRTNILLILETPKAHVTLEYRLRHRDGSWHWVRSIFSNQLSHPAIQGILANSHDITRLKELELDLKASEGRMRAIVEAIPDMYLIVRQDGVILAFQDKGMDNALMHHPSVVGLHGCDLPLPSVDLKWMCDLARIACETNQLQTTTYEIELNGKRHIREVRIQRSGPDEVLALIRDITEMKNTEERLMQAHKLEALGVVASGISHHFSNLLMNIQSHLELVTQRLPKESPFQRNLENIQHSLTRAAYITNQLRDFAGHPALFPEWVDLNQVIQETASLRLEACTTPFQAEFNLDNTLPKIQLDLKLIRRVLLNLLSNACEAMEVEPRSISIRTRLAHLNEQAISAMNEHNIAGPGDFLAVEIQDAGCGMDSNALARVFDPFFTTKPTGRGMGLSATEGIIRAHHGGIKVESQPGTGSTFTLYLPLQSPSLEEHSFAPVKAIAESANSKKKILVAEDEAILRECLCEFITSRGFQPIEAANGQEAVEAYRAHADEIALVLLDLNMPIMDGKTAFQGIRRINPEVKIVISTGSCEDTISNTPEILHLMGLLRKPYHLAELGEVLCSLACPPGTDDAKNRP